MSTYQIRYTVTARTEFEAVTKAGLMLRTGVHLLGIVSTAPLGTYMWEVVMKVSEDAR